MINMSRKGYIYKIVSDKCDKYYIGSTLKTLQDRFRVHKKFEGYSSKPLFDYDDVRIELIEEMDVNDNKELYRRERELIIQNRDNLLNKNYRFNDEELKVKSHEYQKKKYEAKKEYYSEKAKEYYRNNIDSKREYYEKNREKLLEYQKAKYQSKKALKQQAIETQ